MRVAQEEPLRRPQPRARQRVCDQRLLVAGHLVDPQPLGYRVVDRVPGVQRPQGVLQHQLHLPAVGLQAPIVQRLALEDDLARRRALQPEKRACQRRLAAAGLAHERDDLAGVDLEVDPVDRAHAPAEDDPQVACADHEPTRRQAATRSGPAETSDTDAIVHASITTGQRGWKSQPPGRSPGYGGSPGSPTGA